MIRPARLGALASVGLALVVGVGCPSSSTEPAADGAPPASSSNDSAPTPADASFRREAHAKALGRVREAILPSLRALDPVAAAQVEGVPLRPPRFGATARAELRAQLEPAGREADGIEDAWLGPLDVVVLQAMRTTLARGFLRLRRPPWRDDPRAVLYALAPYLQELEVRIPAGRCDEDGCGIDQLADVLRAGFGEVGSASPATIAAARDDLRSLGAAIDGWAEGRAPEHPVAVAAPALREALAELDAALTDGEAAVASAEPLPWSTVVPKARPGEWKRRPERWSAEALSEWLTHEEAYGHPPRALFDRARATAARMHAMVERESGQPDASASLPRPFDAAACAEAFAPLDAWVRGQSGHLRSELECEAVVRELGDETLDDATIVLRLIDRGIIDPTRLGAVRATAPDIAMLRGQAAPAAQRTTLRVAITAATKQRAAELRTIEDARHEACLAATAVWIHGELGSEAELTPLLQGQGCGPLAALVAAAEARPRVALRGLGLLLLGMGPADAAALDRYWWAPAGLVRDLALPPAPPIQEPPPVQIEPLEGSPPTAPSPPAPPPGAPPPSP